MKNNNADRGVVNFVLGSKLSNLRAAIIATKGVNTHRANRDYKRFNETYCTVLATYFRLTPSARVLP